MQIEYSNIFDPLYIFEYIRTALHIRIFEYIRPALHIRIFEYIRTALHIRIFEYLKLYSTVILHSCVIMFELDW
jgi:hypothetical protein